MKKIFTVFLALFLFIGCNKIDANVDSFNDAFNKTFNENRLEIAFSFNADINIDNPENNSLFEGIIKDTDYTIVGNIAFDKTTQEFSGNISVENQNITIYSDGKVLTVQTEVNGEIETHTSEINELDEFDASDIQTPAEINDFVKQFDQDLTKLKLIESAEFKKETTTFNNQTVTKLTASLPSKKMTELLSTIVNNALTLAKESDPSISNDIALSELAIKAYLSLLKFDASETSAYINNDGYVIGQDLIIGFTFNDLTVSTNYTWSLVNFGDNVQIIPIENNVTTNANSL